jgi:electron transport complex protein RnfG
VKKILKLGTILFVITAIAGILLGWVHEVTREPIARQLQKEKVEAMRATLPTAEDFRPVDVSLPADSFIREVNGGYKGEELVGYDIKVTPKGYGGIIELMVGISMDGRIQGIRILSHGETPGLGAESVKPAFSGQFAGKPAVELSVVKDAPAKEEEIQALTGATITSKAITSAVNQAVAFFHASLKGGGK